MGKSGSPSAKQIGHRDLAGIDRAALKLLRAQSRGQSGPGSLIDGSDHWTIKPVTVHSGDFSFLMRPRKRLLPGLKPPFFWTMGCEEIRMVAVSTSTVVWSKEGGSGIGTHRIWADCRKALPNVMAQLKGFEQSMLALADLERHHPKEVTGVPYLFNNAAELMGQRATSLTGSTSHTRRGIEMTEIEITQIELLDL